MAGSLEKEFELFFKENENILYRIIRGFTDSKDSAKDIVMEAMMIVYDRWEKVRNFNNRTGYAVRVAINKAKKNLMMRRLKSWLVFQPDEELLSNASTLESPEDFAVYRDQEKWLAEELDNLKENEKRIILLKDMEKKKFEDISALLNMKLPTVKSIYRRGKLKLTRSWEVRYAE